MDFGERLSRQIEADIERRLETVLLGKDGDLDVKGVSSLALLGIGLLFLLALFVAVVVLLVKLVV
jgi:hypothetical protein